jgi:hypothetical protein
MDRTMLHGCCGGELTAMGMRFSYVGIFSSSSLLKQYVSRSKLNRINVCGVKICIGVLYL